MNDIYMYRKVSLSSFHNGKVEYCITSGSGDIEENSSAIFFYSDFRKKTMINQKHCIRQLFDERREIKLYFGLDVIPYLQVN